MPTQDFDGHPRAVAAFAVTARDETDLARLTEEMLRVVDETVQPQERAALRAEYDRVFQS